MAERLEKRICRLLVQNHPGSLSAPEICRELDPPEDKKNVNRILYTKLTQKGLCDVNTNNTPPRYCASQLLLHDSEFAQSQSRNDDEGQRDDPQRDHKPEILAPPTAVEEQPIGMRSTAPSPSRQRHSILPVKPRPKQNDIPRQQLQPVYLVDGQMYANAAPAPPPAQFHPQTVYVQQPLPPTAQWRLQPVMIPQQQQQPAAFVPPPESVVTVQRAPARSILPLKRMPKNPTQFESPAAPSPVTGPAESPVRMRHEGVNVQRSLKEEPVRTLNDGYMDGSIFPDGLWNHVLHETREARARTRAIEKLMSRNFAPEPARDEGRSGMFTRVRVKPEGGGLNSASMDAVQSLNSMGPPPPGFTLTPRDRSTADAAPQGQQTAPPVTHFSQDSSENMSIDNPQAP